MQGVLIRLAQGFVSWFYIR